MIFTFILGKLSQTKAPYLLVIAQIRGGGASSNWFEHFFNSYIPPKSMYTYYHNNKTKQENGISHRKKVKSCPNYVQGRLYGQCPEEMIFFGDGFPNKEKTRWIHKSPIMLNIPFLIKDFFLKKHLILWTNWSNFTKLYCNLWNFSVFPVFFHHQSRTDRSLRFHPLDQHPNQQPNQPTTNQQTANQPN